MTDSDPVTRVLVVGATGSIGRLVVEEALEAGLTVRVQVRRAEDASTFPQGVQAIVADLANPDSLGSMLEDVDAVVFTHGTYGSVAAAEAVDYGGVRNILLLAKKPLRIALMTAIAVTDRKGAHDWKRRAERLVRLSGHPYTIIRPGWFDMSGPDQLRLVALQGDQRQSGTPQDGVIARRQLAQVLVAGLLLPQALRKTFELVAEAGPAAASFGPMLGALEADKEGAVDGALDQPNMDLSSEPQRVLADIDMVRKSD